MELGAACHAAMMQASARLSKLVQKRHGGKHVSNITSTPTAACEWYSQLPQEAEVTIRLRRGLLLARLKLLQPDGFAALYELLPFGRDLDILHHHGCRRARWLWGSRYGRGGPCVKSPNSKPLTSPTPNPELLKPATPQPPSYKVLGCGPTSTVSRTPDLCQLVNA